MAQEEEDEEGDGGTTEAPCREGSIGRRDKSSAEEAERGEGFSLLMPPASRPPPRTAAEGGPRSGRARAHARKKIRRAEPEERIPEVGSSGNYDGRCFEFFLSVLRLAEISNISTLSLVMSTVFL